MGSAGQKHLNLVAGDPRVARHQRQTLELRLGDEHAVERVRVMRGERPRLMGVGEG